MRLIAYIILILIFYYVIKAYLFPKKNKPHNNKPTQDGEEMVLDEVCQTYFPKDSVLAVRNGNNIHYFCSDDCREKYLKDHRP